MDKSTQVCDACETLKIKETNLCLENETVSKEKIVRLENFQELENKLKALQKDLKEVIELLDHVKTKRCDLERMCTFTQRYEDLEKSKHNLRVECENHKKSVKFLNKKVSKNGALEGYPQDVVKLHEEIDFLNTTLAKFVRGTKALNKILMYCRCLTNKSGKVGHMTSKCLDLTKKGKSNAFRFNKIEPKKIWVPKDKYIHVADVFDSRKNTLVMVHG